MSITLKNKATLSAITRHLEKAGRARSDSIEKLASGQVFTKEDPRPAERALSEQMEFRIRSLASSKRNINDGISLLQTAEAAMNEVNNIILRMKELNISAATTTVSDQERRYLFIEYQALRDELDRIAHTTEYNGLPLLNGQSDKVPEELLLRIDDPFISDDSQLDIDDVNVIQFRGIKDIVTTAEGLGLPDARDALNDSDEMNGIDLETVQYFLNPDEIEEFPTVYDQALNALSTQRAIYGAMQSRLQRAKDFVDVYQENISAAKSNLADTDYAKEIVRMTQSAILMQASSGLLSQANFDQGITLNLLSTLNR